MILVDANILLYAEDTSSSLNKKAIRWWDQQLSGENTVCLCWPVLMAFIRIATNARVFEKPLSLTQAIKKVQSWIDQPCVQIIHPSSRHWENFQSMLTQGQASANLTTDAHLAALAIENGCTLYSTDADFSRFPRLKWENPLLKV